MSHSDGYKLFKLRPKLHKFYEIALQLTPVSEGGHVLSPVATCCWTDEDYIGKVSRVARSCHGATQSIGAMRKSLGMYKIIQNPVRPPYCQATVLMEMKRSSARNFRSMWGVLGWKWGETMKSAKTTGK